MCRWPLRVFRWHGALRIGGKYYKFNDPKGTAGTHGLGINDNHLVVGSYSAGGWPEGFKKHLIE
jgi:hypothetical protein